MPKHPKRAAHVADPMSQALRQHATRRPANAALARPQRLALRAKGLPGRRLVRAILERLARLAVCQDGAVTVEYGLAVLIAAAILYGVEDTMFRPMAKDILKNFMDFIAKPYP